MDIFLGYCKLFGQPIPDTLRRPAGQQQQYEQPERPPPVQEPALQLAMQPPDDDHEIEDDVNTQ